MKKNKGFIFLFLLAVTFFSSIFSSVSYAEKTRAYAAGNSGYGLRENNENTRAYAAGNSGYGLQENNENTRIYTAGNSIYELQENDKKMLYGNKKRNFFEGVNTDKNTRIYTAKNVIQKPRKSGENTPRINAENFGLKSAYKVAENEESFAAANEIYPKEVSAKADTNAENAMSNEIYSKEAFAKADNGAESFASKSVYLVDFNTGTELFERNSDKKLTIASMVKIMTLLLSFEAIDGGVITFDTDVQISGNAAGMGGSQVFLDENSVHKVENLLKAITVCSANDASVAMAETVAGSEEIFVAKMNERAKALGMENTVFTNCTGLPKEGQYSTARDVSKMYRELLKHKDYFRYTKVWLEDYIHPDGRKTEMTNTNKLVRFYKGCDSGKTGFTNESMYCLSSSAVNGNMRVVAVVMGAETSPKRFDDAKKLFNYAFASYENKKLVEKSAEIPNEIKVKGGKTEVVRIVPSRDIFALNKKGGGVKFSVEYELPKEIKAKISKGQTVGKVIVKKDGEVVDSCEAVAADGIEKATILDGIKKIISKW